MSIHNAGRGLRFLLLGSASFLFCESSHAAKSKEGKLSLTPVVMARFVEGRLYARVALANESDEVFVLRGRTSPLRLDLVLYRDGVLLPPDHGDIALDPPREDELVRLEPGQWVIASAHFGYVDDIPPGIYEACASYGQFGSKYGLTPELSETWFLVEVVDEMPRDPPPMLRGTRRQFRGGFAMDAQPLWIDAPEGRPAGERAIAKPDRGHPSDEVEVLLPSTVFPCWAFCALAAYAGLATAGIVVLSVKVRKAQSRG